MYVVALSLVDQVLRKIEQISECKFGGVQDFVTTFYVAVMHGEDKRLRIQLSRCAVQIA